LSVRNVHALTNPFINTVYQVYTNTRQLVAKAMEFCMVMPKIFSIITAVFFSDI